MIARLTGLTGSTLLLELLADSSITQVISISRRPLEIQHAKLTEVLVPDLAELPHLAPMLRGDLYFCCLGTTLKLAGSKESFAKVDHDAVLAFARIAKAHQAKSFTLVSTMGANARSIFYYPRTKGRTEDDVKALGLRSLLLFRPALLAGPRPKHRLQERILGATLVPLSRFLPPRTERALSPKQRRSPPACSPKRNPPHVVSLSFEIGCIAHAESCTRSSLFPVNTAFTAGAVDPP